MDTEKKYKLTNETIVVNGITLYRIEALKDFSDVKEGDKGGFVESEANLSQYDDCWIYNDAKVYDNAKVYGNARIFNNAMIFMNVNVYGNASVFGDAKVYGYSRIFDSAMLGGNAQVYDNAKVCNNAKVYGNTQIFGYSGVFDSAIVCGNSKVFGDASIFGNAKIENANIANNSDYIVFKNWWSSARYFTWTRSNNMWVAGCFCGTGEKLIAKAYKDSELSGREYERIVNYVRSIL